jgi:hypothetical protein
MPSVATVSLRTEGELLQRSTQVSLTVVGGVWEHPAGS